MKRFEKQINFISEINKTKEIFRQSILPDSKRNENDAEHSWHLAVMAITLEEYMKPNTDLLKVLKLVLVHDLVEIYAGDTYCYDTKGYEDKFEREVDAANKLFGLLDSEQNKYFYNLWIEFEEKKTIESEFANILDRLQPFLLHLDTEGASWVCHSISKTQVLNRMDIVLTFGGEISKFTLKTIDEAVKNGYLKDN